MASASFILGVPSSDAVELAGVSESLVDEPAFSEHRYFDGAAFVETLLPLMLSTSAWATLRHWIHARAEVQKATRISVGGIEMTAIKPADAVRLIELLASRVTVEDSD